MISVSQSPTRPALRSSAPAETATRTNVPQMITRMGMSSAVSIATSQGGRRKGCRSVRGGRSAVIAPKTAMIETTRRTLATRAEVTLPGTGAGRLRRRCAATPRWRGSGSGAAG